MTIQILEGLNYCHEQNVIHRDLKPENIFIFKNENEMIVKIADFGLSKNVEQSIAKSIVGSLNFMAPEFFESNKYDFSVDIWSFGVIFFLILNQYSQKSVSKNYYDFKLSKNRDSIEEYIQGFDFTFIKDYVSIIKECVNIQPNLRPKSNDLLEIFKKIEVKLQATPIVEVDDNSLTKSNISIDKLIIVEESDKSFTNSLENDSLLSQDISETDVSLDKSKSLDEETVAGFLQLIGLSQYIDAFLSKGYDDFEFLKEYGLSDEDFQSIGIELPGHKRKLKIKLEELKNMQNL